jgi:ABC-2 type transport system permease protein
MMSANTLTKITKVESKLFARDTTTSLVALLLPVALMVVFGAVGMGDVDDEAQESGISPAFLPGMVISLSIALLAFSTVPTVLATYREKGILRRLRTTPVHPSQLLTAQLIVNVGAAILAMTAVVLLGGLLFDVGWPSNWPAFVVAFVLFTAAMLSAGLIVAAVAQTAKQGTGLGMLVFFPSMFFAGIWTPGDLMPSWAVPVRDWSPMGAGMESVQAAWVGDWPAGQYLLALALGTVVFGSIAARLFRWE